MSGAGPLREVLAFEQRLPVDDGYGNPESGEFAEVFQCAAQLVAMRGSEAVTASRLTGVQPYTATIRYFPAAAAITTAWRARNVRSGVTYDITTVVPRERYDYIDITCVIGKVA